MRQIDLPNVDSKFIETNSAVLAELFDLVLHPDLVKTEHSSATYFHLRYGFRGKPSRIRFRILDPTIRWASLDGTPDVEMDADSFASLKLPIQRVFVTENEINFLAFPEVPRAIVVFGAGYGIKSLGYARWITSLWLYYWGDIDTHGFAILDELRRQFGHVKSMLMDRETMLHYRISWSVEAAQVKRELYSLTPDETQLFKDLQDGVFGDGVRLEQEKIAYTHLMSVLQNLLAGEDDPS